MILVSNDGVLSKNVPTATPENNGCGPPAQTGYEFLHNENSKLCPDKWQAEFGEFAEVDSDGDGFIDFEEFLTLKICSFNDSVSATDLWSSFLSDFDGDRNFEGAVKGAICASGYEGSASTIRCEDGSWTSAEGCTLPVPGENNTAPEENNPSSVIEQFSLSNSTVQGWAFTADSLTRVTQWISKESSKGSMSFCYRHRYDRGAGTALHCGGKVQVGLECFHHCRGGYTGIGHHCCSFWSGCYGRRIGWINSCSSDRYNQNSLCYKYPRHNYECEATGCSKNCDRTVGGQAHECGLVGALGAGCSATADACAAQITGMITGPLMLLVSIATMGQSTAATTGMRTALRHSKAGLEALKAAKRAERTARASRYYNRATRVHDAVTNLNTARNTMQSYITSFIDAAKDDLNAILPSHIQATVSAYCPKGSTCYTQIAEKWGTEFISAAVKAADTAAVMQYAESVDPTGILGIYNTFNQETCQDANTNMPPISFVL
jgi:hypothetical protein